jgi:methyl-accepting chemotaxis protein
MQTSITLNALGNFIIFVLILMVGGYILVTLKKINSLVGEIKQTVQKNKEHINQIIPNINEISKNSVTISNSLKTSVNEAGESIKMISRETIDAAVTINETVNHLTQYTNSMGEIVRAIIRLFSSDKK